MIIKHLEQKNTTLKSVSLSGLSIKAFLNADVFEVGVSTQYGSSKLDFSKASLKVTLIRDSKEHIICQDNLKIIGLASSLNTRGQLAFYSDNDHYTKLGNGQSLLAFNVNFGGIINLRGNDQILIEVINQTGVFADGFLTTSYLEIRPLKAVGYESFIPSIKSYVVQGGESSNQYNIGDNCIKLVALNFDKASFESPVIAQLNFNSDRLSDGFTYTDLVNFKEQGFPKLPANLSVDSATIFESDQSFTLIDGQVFNSVVLDCQFNSANVVASKNYFVAWTYKTDLTIINRAEKLFNKHKNLLNDRLMSSTV